MDAIKLGELFFLQLAFVLVASRIFGLIGRKFNQPQVVCEMITGVILGPSLFGVLFPETFNTIYPKESMPILFSVAQLGLSLYMFTVGIEFNIELLKEKSKQAFAVSITGITVPMLCSIPLTYFFLNNDNFFSPGVPLLFRIIFVGAAISITAFPMLARIIKECNLSSTRLGSLVLAAGAGDDVVAWSLLALITSSLSGSYEGFIKTIIGGFGYLLFCFFLLRPLIQKMFNKYVKNGSAETETLFNSIILAFLMIGCWYTDFIGIFSVFGAFIFGASLPKGVFKEKLNSLITPITTLLILPVFFIYSGLNTHISLILDFSTLLVALIVILVSVLAKGFACFVAARATGEPLKNSIAIGALMNARGLMELILLNIGLQYGLITIKTYTIFVLMAVVTTVIASPIWFSLYRRGLQYC
jgi:Kef-type K+ transport system membrane component KefB